MRRLKKILSVMTVLTMTASMVPVNVFAARQVNTTPGGSELAVEYFNSTLYNWDEDEANKATRDADSSIDSYTSVETTYQGIAVDTSSEHKPTNYYYKATDAEDLYYPVYYTKVWNGYRYGTTYTLFYKTDDGYVDFASTTIGNSSVSLWQKETTYEGKGFYFTSAGNKAANEKIPAFSKWSGPEQNYKIYSGLAADNLNESNNIPFNNETVNAAALFATDNSNSDYTNVYTNVSVPFVYDEETGYYTLDSDKNGVYFADGEGQSDVAMEIADKPSAYRASTRRGNKDITGFAPFNSLGGEINAANVKDESVRSYQINDNMVYGFGMVTEVPFQMTDDGKDAKGNPIEFAFSGDDDVWVYVDDVLALDIGGTHDAITGTINFTSGDVVLKSAYNSTIGDNHTGEMSDELHQENLYDKLQTTLTGFASQGQHTLTVYYMDRGQGATNCLIKFNLPQRDTVSVTKNISQYYTESTTGNNPVLISDEIMNTLNNVDFSFTAYKNGDEVVRNRSYSVYDREGALIGTGSTDSQGNFKLKNGQTAMFKNIDLDSETSYYVVEKSAGDRWSTESEIATNIDEYTVEDKAVEGGTASQQITVTGSETATDIIEFTFTNSYGYQTGYSVDAVDDTVVLDYGLAVKVPVTDNDTITNEGSALTDYTLAIDDQSNTLKYGRAEITEDRQICYTQQKHWMESKRFHIQLPHMMQRKEKTIQHQRN